MEFIRDKAHHLLIPALAALLFLAGALPALSAGGPEGVTVGGTAGYTRISGYYTSYFDNGMSLGLTVSYPLTFIGRYVLADGEFSGEKWAMKQNSDYTLTAYTFRGGPLFYYPFLPYIYPFLGFYFQESSVYLRLGSDGKREQSYKPGYAVKSGLVLATGRGIGIRLGVEYSSFRISGRDFNQTAFTGGIIYNYLGFVKGRRGSGAEDEGPARKVELLILDGKKLFAENSILEAKRDFLMVLKLQPGNREAESYLARIAAMEQRLRAAENLIAVKRYYEAIPILVEIRPYLKKAGEDLVRVRGLLSPEIAEMEKVGVNAYEKKDYDLCIFHMERLLLIDPNNGAANIYLPRAKKRKEALEKFQ